MSDPFLGEIRLFAFPRLPQGWLFCTGQTVAIATYNTLFSLLGTAFGGDGITTFGLPNLKGRVPIGTGTGVYPNTNPALHLTPRTIGNTGGSETDTLTQVQVPTHTHYLQATIAASTTETAGPNVMLAGDTTGTKKHYVNPVPTTPPPTIQNFADQSIMPAGGNLPHPNLMPSLCLNFCICYDGIWPQRS